MEIIFKFGNSKTNIPYGTLMKCRFVKYSLAIVLALFYCMSYCLADCKTENAGGLGFRSNKVPISDRTSYAVFGRPVKFPRDRLEMRFDISLYGSVRIGHILTCKNGREIFNLIVSNAEKYDSLLLNFNITVSNSKLVLAVPKAECRPNVWHEFALRILPEDGYAEISLDGRSVSTSFEPADFPEEKVRYVFGKCDHYLDVFDFAIRNLCYTGDGKTIRCPLSERNGNIVYDDKGKKCGWVYNPDWLIMSHYKWNKILEINENEIAAVFLDSVSHSLVIRTSDKYYELVLSDRSFSEYDKPSAAYFRLLRGGGCNYLWLDKQKKLILFNCMASEPEEYVSAEYDRTRDVLCLKGKQHLSSRRHHNSVFGNKAGSGLYLFGGYGSFRYSNTFHFLDFDSFDWSDCRFSGDYIEPRFYSAVATDYSGDNETVYLYGGYGNISGRQDDGSQYFHDLYRIDLKNRTIEEIFDFRLDEFDMVPSRDIILGKDGHSFYSLCFRQYKPKSFMRLYRFDWETGECIPVSDSIQFVSQKISTQVHLFNDSYTGSLIGIIQEFTDPDTATIKIYSLTEPLLTTSFQDREKKELSRFAVAVAVIVLLALSSCVYVFLRADRKKISGEQSETQNHRKPKDDIEDSATEAVRPNSVYLLGGFTAINRNGRDVSYMFSAKIRQLFLLILLYTVRESSKGITPAEVSSILWPDRDPVKSRNIRGVTIKNLKTVLEELDGVRIVNSSGKWYMEYDGNIFFCDYIRILSAGKNWNVKDYATIRADVRMLRRGPLLAGEEYGWMDVFKSGYEEHILETWVPVMHEAFENGSYMVSYKLSQVLLSIDRFGEDILKIEVRSLINLGDYAKAKMKFRHFAIDYYEAYGKNLSFEDFA